MVDAASSINLWKEWAAIENALAKELAYKLPKVKKGYAGIVLTLSKFEYPDLSVFNDPEICFRVPLAYHAGMIVKATKSERVLTLLDAYATRLVADFATVVAQKEVDKLH